MKQSRWAGTLIGAVAAALYGMNPLFTLPLYREGLGPGATLFFRYSLALLVLWPIFLFMRKPLRIARDEIVPVLFVGLLFAVSSLALFESYLYMDVGIASTLLFVYPVLVAVLMALFFHEKPGWATFASVALVTAGIALLNRGAGGKALNPTGFWMVMVSAFSYAAFMIAVNRPRLMKVDGLVIVFYSLLIGSILFAGEALFAGRTGMPKTAFGWMNAVGLALLPTAVSDLGTTVSIRMIGPTPCAILGALEPVTAVVIGTMVFGERLTPRIICGIVLVLSAVLLIVFRRKA
jgi:drug/metabolite transporter (DMT)-like permease